MWPLKKALNSSPAASTILNLDEKLGTTMEQLITPGYMLSVFWEHGVLICFMCVLTAVFIHSYAKVRKQYRQAIALIEQLRTPLIVAAQQNGVETKREFLNKFSETPLAFLRGSLHSFMPGIVGSDNITTDTKLQSFFNLQLIRDEFISEEFMGFAKSICISIGVLGTFLGLVLGINGAAAGLASTDANLARMALEELLSGAGIAFITSLAGLSCALVISRTVAVLDMKLCNSWSLFEKDFIGCFPYSNSSRNVWIIRDVTEKIESSIAQQNKLLKEILIGQNEHITVSKRLYNQAQHIDRRNQELAQQRAPRSIAPVGQRS